MIFRDENFDLLIQLLNFDLVEVKVLKQHLTDIIYNEMYSPAVKFGLLSNDNGFMGNGTWMRRTLTAK
jgi:hypothetical protein